MIRVLLGLIVAHFAGASLAQDSPPARPESGNKQSLPANADDGIKPSAPLSLDNGNKLTLSVSPYVQHFNLNGDYDHVWLVGIEREHLDGKLDGIAFFNNSFGQPSVYVFPWGGVYKGIYGIAPLSFKWTAGLFYGYVGEYQDRVPLNYKGFSPAVNVALAWQFTPVWAGQVTLAGSFLMFQINMALK